MPERIILFDLGNVVVDWNPVRLYRQIFETEEEAVRFCAEICTMAWHVEHDRGVPMVENGETLKARYPGFAREIDAWRLNWWDMFDGYVEGVPDLIRRLDQAGRPLYGLSNLSHEVWPGLLERFPAVGRLRDVVVSGAEGVIKPDPEIYRIALRRMGNPLPGQVFFIDDSAANIDAAASLGFDTHHFQGAAGLERALTERGLL